MRKSERMKKVLSALLCLCMLVQYVPTTAVAVTTAEDGLCEHHPEHTADCGYAEAVAGQDCTHKHSEDCYAILECLHTCTEDCDDPCTHQCTVNNGCITMDLDCHHTHGDCGYSEGTAEVPCGHVHNESCGYAEAVAGTPCANAETDPECDHLGSCGYVAAVEGQPCGHTACDDTCGYAPATEGTPCTHTHSVIVGSDASCYDLLCSHKDGGHDDACGYVAAVEAHECHYECVECAAALTADETTTPSTEATTEPSTEATESAPVCDCGTDDESIHATTCAVYVAPENPQCYCVEKCTEVNVWCDICGFDISKCGGEDTAAAFAAEAETPVTAYTAIGAFNYIAARGTEIHIEAGTNGGTAVYYMNGTAKTYINENGASGDDLSTWRIYGGSGPDQNSAAWSPSIIMTGGNVAYIHVGNLYGRDTVNAKVVITGGTVGLIDFDGNPEAVSNGTSSGIVLIDIPTVWSSDCFTGVYQSNGTWYVCGDAEIPSGYEVVIESGETMTVDSGETLTNNGTIVNNDTITVNGILNNNGTLGNSGTITANGTLNNYGTINGNGTIYLNAHMGDGEDKITGNEVIRNALCIETTTSGTPVVYVNGSEITDFATEYSGGKLYIYPKHTGNVKVTLNGKAYYGIIESENGSSELSSEYISVTDIGFSLKEMSIGQMVDLADYVSITPTNTTYETTVTYEVLNSTTAQYSLSGTKLTARSAGTIALKITAQDPFDKYEKIFTITIAAADVIDVEAGSVTVSKSATNGKLTVTWIGFDGGSKEYDVTDPIVITSGSGTSQGTIIVQDGVTANIVLNGVDITSSISPFHIQGTAAVNLTLLGDNVLDGSAGSENSRAAGIRVENGASLTIDGTGTLTARGGQYAAGIGGTSGDAGGTITINGGTVTAIGGKRGAGIGGGYSGAGGTITIKGGTVTANGGQYAAGIGGGRYSSGGTVTISGGTVTANGGQYAAGIGNGREGSGGNITISGGTVTANGNGGGAGIGGGALGAGGIITINGGTVTANGSTSTSGNRGGGAGIGGGNLGSGGTVVITGGTVRATAGNSASAIGGGYDASDAGTLTNGTESVSLVTVTLNGASADTAVSAVTGMTYGVNGVKTQDTDKLYFYLPSGTEAAAITAGGTVYDCKVGLTYYPGHEFICESAKNCRRCNYIGGKHNFVDGVCTTCFRDKNGVYYISTPEQLKDFAARVNAGEKNLNAILMADIDLEGYEWTTICETGLYYNAYGTDLGYCGTFDGNGHIIKNITVKSSETMDASCGLFGTVSGTIKNLGIEGFTFVDGGKDIRAGAIVGQLITANGKVSNCYVKGATITPGEHVTGGIAGCVYDGSIENCYVVESTITGTEGRFGYIVGDSRGDKNASDRRGTVTNCYSDNATLRSNNVGIIENCETKSKEAFASGEVTYLLNGSKSDSGLVWYQTLGTDAVPKFAGGTVYKVSCVDYSNENKDYVPHNFVDGICSICGEPTPAVENNGIYEISNAGQYIWFAKFVNAGNADAKAKLMADIDLSEYGNVMIGISSVKYSGTFDGNGKKLTVNFNTTEEYAAPFRYISGATIQNLTVDGTIATSAKFAAGLVGYSQGTGKIEKCMVGVTINSSVNGDGTHGGLVANVSSGSMTIDNCGFIGSITGDATDSCGGFVGWAGGKATINNSYICGTFTTGTSNCNTFGRNAGNITVSNSYYETTYGTDNEGATQKSAEQFASGEVTYLLNGSTSDGDLVWYQTIGTDSYPQFAGSTVYSYITCTNNTGYANAQLDDGAHLGEYTASDNVISGQCLVCGIDLGTATLSGGTYSGEACKVIVETATGVLATKNITLTLDGDAPVDAGTYTVTVTIDGKSFEAQFTIAPKPLTIVGAEVESKDYDGTPFVQIDSNDYNNGGFKVEGVWQYDRITISCETAELASANADSYGMVTVKGLKVNGEDAHNYTIVSEAKIPVYNIWGNYESSVTVWEKSVYIDLLDQEAGSPDAIDQSKWEIGEDFGLLEGHRIDSIKLIAEMNSGSVKYGSISVEEGSLKIVDADGNDVTANYSVTAYAATLTITCPDHDEFENGFCKNCGGFEKPNYNENEDYYEIANAGQLFWFAEYIANVTNEANAKLMDDITIPEGKEWIPIYNLYGTFDGNYKTISGLHVSDTASDYVGFLGYIGSWADVRNLHITNSSFVDADATYVGAIVGYHGGGEITNCYTDETVKIETNGTYGALVGGTSYSTMKNCYAHDVLAGNGHYGTFENCYYIGEDDGIDGTTAMTAEQFASGEVAYRLQSGIVGEDIWDDETGEWIGTTDPDLIWGQTIGTEDYPVLKGKKVYFDETANPQYYNEKSEIISVDITWGAMSFTYTDGEWNPETHTYGEGKWTPDDENGNVITVTNNGTVDAKVTFAYDKATGMDAVSGSFTIDGTNGINEVALAVGREEEIYLLLTGEPNETNGYVTLGTITVTITTGGE